MLNTSPDHSSNGGNCITNFKPRAKLLYESAIKEHPECGLFISDEPMDKTPGFLSLRLKTDQRKDLTDFWKTFWRLQEELNIQL